MINLCRHKSQNNDGDRLSLDKLNSRSKERVKTCENIKNIIKSLCVRFCMSDVV